jgi:RND family efflux transporter MFP subunit
MTILLVPRGARLAPFAVCLVLAAAPSVADERPPASVQVAQAEIRQLAPAVRAAGLVRSRASADLAASVAGRLQWVAEAGTPVEAGAPVARLDTRELTLARAEQAARVNRASVNLKSLDRELERLRASGNAVSRYAVDQAQSNRDLAAADLEVERALLAQTDDQLSRSRLSAPFAGVVSDRVRRAGEEVARGEVVARIVNPDELEIRLFVPLRYVRAIHPGHVVNVTTDSRSFTAAVSSIVPAGDPRTQSFEVVVKAPSVDGLLASGDTVQVELPLGDPQRRLAVPRDALIIRVEGLHVYRITPALRAERVAVTAGLADGDWIAVDGPLSAGDRVVVRGGELLRGDEKVQIVGTFEEDTPARRAAQAR